MAIKRRAGNADAPDPTKLFDAPKKVRVRFQPYGIGAGLRSGASLAAAGFTEFPVKELLSIVKRLLLF